MRSASGLEATAAAAEVDGAGSSDIFPDAIASACFLSLISAPCAASWFVIVNVVAKGFEVMAAVVIDMIEVAEGARRTSLFFDGVSGSMFSFDELRLRIEVFDVVREGGGTVTSF